MSGAGIILAPRYDKPETGQHLLDHRRVANSLADLNPLAGVAETPLWDRLKKEAA